MECSVHFFECLSEPHEALLIWILWKIDENNKDIKQFQDSKFAVHQKPWIPVKRT